MSKGTCSIEACSTDSYIRGWCRKHYTAWQRYGDPLRQGDNRHPHGWRRNSVWPSDDEIVELYRELGSRKAIALHLGCSNTTLTRYIKMHPMLDAALAAARPAGLSSSERSREYRERHPGRRRRQAQEYYANNRDKVLEDNRKWHQNNRHVVRLRKRREYQENPDRIRQAQREWVDRNRDKVRLRVQLRYHQRKGDRLSAEYGRILLNDPCSYCGAVARHIDHIDPISRGGSGAWDNLTAACASCNTSKQDRTLLTFMLDWLVESDFLLLRLTT